MTLRAVVVFPSFVSLVWTSVSEVVHNRWSTSCYLSYLWYIYIQPSSTCTPTLDSAVQVPFCSCNLQALQRFWSVIIARATNQTPSSSFLPVHLLTAVTVSIVYQRERERERENDTLASRRFWKSCVSWSVLYDRRSQDECVDLQNCKAGVTHPIEIEFASPWKEKPERQQR